MPTCVAVMGSMLIPLLSIRTKPKRNSLTSEAENRCVSDAEKKRSCTGNWYGKLRSVELAAAPREACNPPPPKGKSDLKLVKKKRAEILSLKSRKSLSQLAVN